MLDSEEEGMLEGLDDDEIERIMDTMDEDASADDLMAAIAVYRALKDDSSLPPSSSSAVPPKNKRKASPPLSSLPSRSKKAKHATPAPLPTLAPLPSSSRPKKPSTPKAAQDDYADATSLSLTDATDKASKRHSLRFHVSQVSQKTARRESGGKNRVGGDEDLPRRSKERSRREVLKRQEHGGGKGEELDGMDWAEDDREVAKGSVFLSLSLPASLLAS